MVDDNKDVHRADDMPGKSRNSSKSDYLRTRLTIYYYDLVPEDHREEEFFLDTPCGLVPMWLTAEEGDHARCIYREGQDAHNTYVLAGGKELDPRRLEGSS